MSGEVGRNEDFSFGSTRFEMPVTQSGEMLSGLRGSEMRNIWQSLVHRSYCKS